MGDKGWSSEAWKNFLNAGHTASSLDQIRRNTHTGRPLGSADFTRALESKLERHLAPKKPGPRKKATSNNNQPALPF
jgi:hypothetical protein